MKNNGGDTDYYKIKPEWKMAQDIIEDRQMNYAQGNIFKVAYCFNIGRHDATDYIRELNKISWFIEREKNRINNINKNNTGLIFSESRIKELLGSNYDEI